jgi:hypothetical protein
LGNESDALVLLHSLTEDKTMKTNYSASLLAVALLAAVTFTTAAIARAQYGATTARPSDVMAIDILLEPDATMLQHAAANNARLRQVYPEGFDLDATHTPHITMLQCFVRTADLDKLYATEEKMFVGANINAMKLEAFKYYYAPADATTGVAGICAKPSPGILKLQADVIVAAKPFMQKTASASAFTAPHQDPATDAAFIKYISTFVPKMSGKHFNPHVSIGVATKDYLDKMLTETFESFTFSPVGAAIYQLGPYGTAAKQLEKWNLDP